MSKPKTVRARICVVVDDEGRYTSSGWTQLIQFARFLITGGQKL